MFRSPAFARAPLRLRARRWLVFAAALLAGALLTVAFAQDGGVYSSRTSVVFTFPGIKPIEPYNGSEAASIIAFAQTVSLRANGGAADARYYSTSAAPLYGAGLREAVVIGVRDEGGQWNSSVSSATIEVQIVGRTREWVEQQQDLALAKVIEISEAEQAVLAVDAEQRLDAHVEPLTRAIEQIQPSRSAQLAAVGAMVVASSIVGGVLAWAVGRRRRRGELVRARRGTQRTKTGVAS